MLEARFDRAAVPLRAAVSWILFGDFSAPIPAEPRPPWIHTPSDVPTAEAHQAQEQLLVALRDGDLHATGRYSDMPTPAWESSGRRWMMHSGRHTQILNEHWRGGQYSWNYGSLDLPDGQYIEIQVPRHMIVAIWPPQPEPEVAPGTSAGSSAAYTTPYLDLMRRAIDELRISAANQPKKETVVAWFGSKRLITRPSRTILPGTSRPSCACPNPSAAATASGAWPKKIEAMIRITRPVGG